MADIKKLQSEVNRLNNRLNKALSRLDSFDEHATEDHLNKMEGLARESRKRAQVELQKNIVLSEIGRYCALEHPNQFHQIFLSMLEDMDREYDWWAQGKEWTIKEWEEYLLDRASKKEWR